MVGTEYRRPCSVCSYGGSVASNSLSLVDPQVVGSHQASLEQIPYQVRGGRKGFWLNCSILWSLIIYLFTSDWLVCLPPPVLVHPIVQNPSSCQLLFPASYWSSSFPFTVWGPTFRLINCWLIFDTTNSQGSESVTLHFEGRLVFDASNYRIDFLLCSLGLLGCTPVPCLTSVIIYNGQTIFISGLVFIARDGYIRFMKNGSIVKLIPQDFYEDYHRALGTTRKKPGGHKNVPALLQRDLLRSVRRYRFSLIIVSRIFLSLSSGIIRSLRILNFNQINLPITFLVTELFKVTIYYHLTQPILLPRTVVYSYN